MPGANLRRLAAVLMLLILVLTGCAAQSASGASSLDLYRTRLRALAKHDFFESTRILDRNGVLLAELAPNGQRIWAKLNQIPLALQQAIIATEDRTFYTNSGVDAGAVARAALQNAGAGETVSGASTISMQLTRLVAFDAADRQAPTLERKWREAHLAAELSDMYSKADILEDYLNIAYFGHGAYGVEAAANVYFGRHAEELTISQATLTAGLVQAPALLDPWINLEGAKQRQRIVLNRMVDEGYLTADQSDEVFAVPVELSTAGPPAARKAGHFVDYVMTVLPELVGHSTLARGGITVTTSLDLALSERLTKIAADRIEGLRAAHDVSDAAIVVVKPSTGEILAMVGGLDYNEAQVGQVNAATAMRQPGSAIKPIVYAAALENGFTPASVLFDVPYSFPTSGGALYKPVNYDGTYHGPVRLRHALANSLNAATVDLIATMGVPTAHALAIKMGLPVDPDPWHYGLSFALGSPEVSLVQLTGAYASFATQGQYAAPSPILKVEPLDGGDPVYLHAAGRRSVVSAQTAWLISDILSDRTARQPAFSLGGPLETSRTSAVKTGTTNDFRDNFTVGYTPYVAVGVWAGNKDGRPMKDVLGITGAAPIWHDTMESIFADPVLMHALGGDVVANQAFKEPDGIERVGICDLNALPLDATCRTTVNEVFRAGTWTGDLGTTFDWFSLRSRLTSGFTSRAPAGNDPSAGGAIAGWCTMATGAAVRGAGGSGGTGGRVLLKVDRPAEAAKQIRDYVNARGLRVEPAGCGG